MTTPGVLLLTTWMMLWPETETNLKILSLRYPKEMFSSLMPYLGLQSKFMTKQLKSCIYKFYGCINLNSIFRNTRRINSLFPYKDRLNRSLMSKVVYKASCWDCDDFLYKNKAAITWPKNRYAKRTSVCYLDIQRSLGKEGNARFANEGHLRFVSVTFGFHCGRWKARYVSERFSFS